MFSVDKKMEVFSACIPILMGQQATLKKISTQLNISISTVSRALKNHPDISENTKRKVKELAALMEYEPNSFAITLRTNKSKIFGVIVPGISNTFYDSFIAAVEKEARQKGYSLLILQSGDDPIIEEENLKLCRHNRVDGIFISVAPNTFSGELFNKYKEAGIPVIFFDKVPPAGNFDTVCLADAEAASLAAATIIKYQKKNILGLFGNPELSITKRRKEAFISMTDKEKTVSVEVQFCNNSADAAGFTQAAVSKNKKPDVVFCMSDEILIGVMKVLNRSGLKIPAEVAVLAISNGFIPGLYYPEITYIETSGYDLGKLSVKRMLDLQDEKTPPQSIILPSKLVAGGSL
jgi:LacI family transcriptional regulator